MTEENRHILGQLAIIGVVVAGLAIYAALYDAWDKFIYIVVAMGVTAMIYLFWVMPIQNNFSQSRTRSTTCASSEFALGQT